MKVLVVAEGPSELGRSPETSSLVALAKRMIQEEEADFACRKVSDPIVRTHRRRGKSANYEKRALGWVRFAEREEFDALVLVIDQDGQPDRETGIEIAQNHVRFPLPRAMGVAILMYDAWMLADEVALSLVLDRNVQRQKQPESIKTPKKVIDRLLNEFDEVRVSEIYFEIAATIDLEKLAQRCPKGFAPFRSRMEALLSD